MGFLEKNSAILLRLRNRGALHVIYALGVEALVIGFVFFTGFFTLETLLPTFVTVRLSLTKFFFVLILAGIALSLLGQFLLVSLPARLTKKSPLLWLGVLWSIGILAISLMKFPPLLFTLFIAFFLLSGYLFFQIFVEKE